MKSFLSSIQMFREKNRSFFHFFIPLFSCTVVLFIIFSLFTYQRSRKILETEFLNSSTQELACINESVDQLITDSKYIIATLVTNNLMQSFYSNSSPEKIWSNYSSLIYAQLATLRYSQNEIETIYLYSDASSIIYSSTSHSYANTHPDRYWLDQLDPDENGFSVFPYALNNQFPYVLCVAKSFSSGGHNCAVAIMLNLSKVANLRSLSDNQYKSAYLISDEGEILYHHRQEHLTESLASSPLLAHYDTDHSNHSEIFSDDGKTYALVQVHSENAPWSYVLVTHLTDYSEKMSSNRAILFALSVSLVLLAILLAFFYAARSTRPLRALRHYLDSADVVSSIDKSGNEDVHYIVTRITQYMQSNQKLYEELQTRLILLNESRILALQAQINPHFLSNTLNLMYVEATDELGYNHPLPLMILNTSSLIRYAIELEQMVHLEDELANTDVYLSILKHRYNQALDVRKSIPEDCLRFLVPRLFIQPIVENAIFHGLSKANQACWVLEIECTIEENVDKNAHRTLTVCVKDNGCGMDAEALAELNNTINTPSKGMTKRVGLRNVVQRMRLIYSDCFSYEIKSEAGTGTSFIFHIPSIE